MTRVRGAKEWDTDDATTSLGFCVLTPGGVVSRNVCGEGESQVGHEHVNENLLHVAHGVSPSHRIYRRSDVQIPHAKKQ